MRGKALRNRVKRGVAFFLAVVMMLSTVMIVQPEKVNAATTVTEKDIYYKCPEYLDNANYTEWMYQCENVMRDGMKDVTKLDEFTASLLYSLQNGGSVILKTIAGSYGLGNDVYQDLNKAVVYSVAQEYMSVSSSVSSDIADINRMFGDINTIINWHDKKQLEIFKDELKANSNLSKEQVEKLVNDFTAGSKDYEKLMKYVSNVGDIAKVVALFAELQQIDVAIIDQLMDIYKPYDTDMYNALDAIRTEHEDIVTFVMNNYVNGKVMGYIIKLVSKPFSDVKGVTDTVSKILTYVLGKLTVPNATDIIKANMYLGYTYLCRNVVNNYIKEFKQGNVTDKKIKQYKLAYDFYVCTVKKTLDAVYKCVDSGNKIKKQNIETYSNGIGPMCYNGYIESCLWFAQRDADSGKLVISNKETIRKTDDGTVMDKSYDSTESIKAKLAVVKQKYPVGMQWNDTFDGAIQCMGFAKLVFYNLYGIHMNTTYISDHRYMYRDSGSINLVSQVSGSNLNADSIKGVMASARIGDVIQACGATYGQHSMIFMGLTDNGICVYDCNAHPDLNDSRDCVIHEWKVSYNTLASWYGSSSSTYGVNGISVYRASNYSQIYGDGTELFYDDSVNFVIEDGVLKKYNGYQAFVEIPDTVTEIGAEAFKNNTTMLNVSIPDGVKKIGNSAFYGCKNLTGVTIPDSVESIGSSVFAECSGMGTVIFPENERFIVINTDTFKNCSSLIKVEIPDSVEEICFDAFKGCKKLSDVKLSKNLETIGTSVFRDCTSLTEITIPKTLEKYNGSWGMDTDYSYGAFGGCSNLKIIKYEEGTTRVCESLFKKCDGIEEVILPDTITEIDKEAFKGCSNLTKVTFSENVVTVGSEAFAGCSSLKELSMNEYLTKIESGAFKNCISLEKVETPDSVEEICFDAFKGCKKLSDVKLSKNLETIGTSVFRDCTSLTEITIPKTLEKYNGSWGMDTDYSYGAFGGCSNLKIIKYEEGTTRVCESLFKKCDGIEEVILPDTITEIDKEAFKGCSNLTKVTFSENVVTVGSEAFAGCSSLKELSMNEYLTKIESGAFKNCISLEKVETPDSVEEICFDAFKGCKKLSDVKLSKNLETIGTSVFRDCTSLTEITIPKTLEKYNGSWGMDTDYSYGAFGGCSNLKIIKYEEGTTRVCESLFKKCDGIEEVILPDTITEIDKEAFKGCSNLTKVTFSENVVAVGSEAFAGCNNLKELSMNEYLTKIESGAFKNCISLEKVEIPDNVSVLSEYIFYNCKKLSEINMPEKLTYIARYAFEGCSSLTSISIGENVNTIEFHAFKDCSALESVKISGNITAIGDEVFSNCTSLKEVTFEGNLSKVSNGMFYMNSKLQNIVLPDTVTEIGTNAFANCTKLTEITIPEATTKIADNAFSYPKKLTIKGVKDSYANKYADDKNIKFEAVIKPSALDTDYIKKYLKDNEHISVDKNNETGKKYITGIRRDMTVGEINSQLIGSNIVIKDSEGKEPETINKISTGYKMILMQNGAVKEDGDIIVKGDIDGNGSIDVLDMEAIQKSILGIGDKLSGVYKEAASLTDGDDITVLDMEAIQKDILGIQKIN